MYFYEDRIRAVKLYIKLGKRTGATIRQLGYPTKNALKSWHREYEQSRDLPVGYVLSRPKYSDEQKKVAVQHYLNHDRCLVRTLKAIKTTMKFISNIHAGRNVALMVPAPLFAASAPKFSPAYLLGSCSS